MMFSLLKKSSILFIFIFLLTSCHFFLPIEPVSEVNRKFKEDYGYTLNRAKNNHKKAIKESGYDGIVPLEETAYGRILQAKMDFIETNARNNPYVEVETAGGKDIKYLSYNSPAFSNEDKDIFSDVEIPKNDFKYYNLGKKEYNEINNKEIQNSYDYIYVINQERLKQIEIARLKEEAIQREQRKNRSLLKRGSDGIKALTNKIKDLLN